AVPHAVQIVLALVLVLPIAPLLDRIAFRPAADASVLVLLIIALALHFALSGLGLMFFGAEGFRIRPLVEGIYSLGGGVIVSAQVLLMVITAALLSLLFFLFFERSMSGRALRATAVNRIGARLVGIRPARTGTIAYFIASLLAGVSAILVGPTTTIYYDSGRDRAERAAALWPDRRHHHRPLDRPRFARQLRHHAAQLYRHLRAGRPRSGAADRDRRHDIVRTGRLCRHRRLRHRLGDRDD